LDKVKFLKLEQSNDGTQSDPFPTEANPTEDYAAIKGIAFENREDIKIESIGNQLRFTDTQVPTISLKEILDLVKSSINFNYNIIESTETLTIPKGQQMIVHGRFKIYGKLIIKGDLILKNW
jgi:hypothetical protein